MGKKNAHKGANPPSGFRKYAGLLFRSQTGTIGFFILLMILIIAIFAPHIAPYDPTSVDLRGMRAGTCGAASFMGHGFLYWWGSFPFCWRGPSELFWGWFPVFTAAGSTA